METTIDTRAYLDAGHRWQRAAPLIEDVLVAGPQAETPERVANYLQHQLDTDGGESLWAGEEAPPLVERFGHERIVGGGGFLSLNVLQKAIAIGRFVGRIGRRAEGAQPVGVATGSMVSPRLLLTNHHVLPSSLEAFGHVIEFDYQLGENDVPIPVSAFELRPDEFFATDPGLDYTLVAVAPTASNGMPLEYFGWSKLVGTQGKILLGHPVNIIQHPEGGYKQIVLRKNRVIQLVDNFFLYETDTLPGSSGSPVYNDQWEVVALHHRGVPRVEKGAIMTKGNRPWTADIPYQQIEWIGNEGIRVSSLVRHIQALTLGSAQDRLRSEMFDLPAPNPFTVSRKALARHAESAPGQPGPPGGQQALTITVPVELHVSIRSVRVSGPPE